MTKVQEFRKLTEEAKFNAFGVMCKKAVDLEQENIELKCQVDELKEENEQLKQQIEQLQKINKEQKETLKKVRVALIQERTANIINYDKGGVEMFDNIFEVLNGVSN